MKRLTEKSEVRSEKLEASGKWNAGIRILASGFLILLYAFWIPTPAFGSTKIFLRNLNPSVMKSPAANWLNRVLNTTQGTSKSGFTQSSKAGPITGQHWPCEDIFITSSANKMAFISLPLSAGVTISGTVTPNFWGYESNNACNCGFRYEMLRWSVAQGGIVSSLGITTDDGAAEWGTSAAVRTSPTLTPTSTNFAAGDRIVLVIYNDDGNGVTQNSGKSWTLDIDAATGVDGDSYLTFTETISFSADTNNARPIPSTSWLLRPVPDGTGLRPLFWWWKQYFDEVFS